MTQEEKKLLLIDLYARIPYGVKVQYYENETFLVDGEVEYVHNDYVKIKNKDKEVYIMGVKPYLRPMSSMTEEEKDEYDRLVMCNASWVVDDWLNAHHFDFRNLIERGLAIDCTNLNIY